MRPRWRPDVVIHQVFEHHAGCGCGMHSRRAVPPRAMREPRGSRGLESRVRRPRGAERGHGRLRPWLTVGPLPPSPRMISMQHAVYAGDGFRSLYAGPPWVASSPGVDPVHNRIELRFSDIPSRYPEIRMPRVRRCFRAFASRIGSRGYRNRSCLFSIRPSIYEIYGDIGRSASLTITKL